jgi:FtsP/CotA-like multicopper oxidase with cupredoxin domain
MVDGARGRPPRRGSARRLAALGIAACTLAVTPAAAHAASSALLSSDAGDAFYCPLHTNAASAASAGATAGQAGAAFARPPQPTLIKGQEFQDPPVLRSHNGVLNVTLNVVRKKVMIGGTLMDSTTYNGLYAGPTLRVKLGDRINVTLVNTAGKLTNQPTNLHFHGLHVSPKGDHDNIFRHVAPGESAKYNVTLGKGNFPGTYWYHSHMHGYSEAQLVNGLSGVIIVEGQRKLLPKAFRGITEHVISLKAAQINDGAISAGKYSVWAESDSPPPNAKPPIPPNVRLVGNQLQPKIRIRPGEVQLWHIANTGANVLYRVQLEKSHFTVISEDANAFDTPQNMKTLFMGGGQRFDVLVTGPKSGVLKLRTIGFRPDKTILAPTRVLATLVSSGKRMKTPPMPTKGILPFIPLDNAPIAVHRTFTFGSDHVGGGPFPRFTINQDVFDENRIDVHAKLGTVEEWTLKNTTGVHPFHMHINAFQVMSINGKPYHAHSRVDTFVLPRTVPGRPPSEMVVRIPFEGFTGKFVFHCHILGHEDLGMMRTIQVDP